MSFLIVVCALVIIALSPLLQRIYMERFWVHAPGTVIRLEGGINTNPEAGGGWVWEPVIEYEVAGQRLNSRVSYWQRIGARSKYAVGDEVKILYDPRRPSRVMLDSWTPAIVITIFISGLIAVLIHQG